MHQTSVVRSAGALGCHTRIRAGFPRDRPRAPVTVVREPAPDRGQDLLYYRSAGACPPRSTDLGEKRPQPRDHGCFLLRPVHGEGQALALREPRNASRPGCLSYRENQLILMQSYHRFVFFPLRLSTPGLRSTGGPKSPSFCFRTSQSGGNHVFKVWQCTSMLSSSHPPIL